MFQTDSNCTSFTAGLTCPTFLPGWPTIWDNSHVLEFSLSFFLFRYFPTAEHFITTLGRFALHVNQGLVVQRYPHNWCVGHTQRDLKWLVWLIYPKPSKHLRRWCFCYVLGVQIPFQEVFGVSTRWWFRFCLFSTLFAEMIQFDEHNFQMGFRHVGRPTKVAAICPDLVGQWPIRPHIQENPAFVAGIWTFKNIDQTTVFTGGGNRMSIQGGPPTSCKWGYSSFKWPYK